MQHRTPSNAARAIFERTTREQPDYAQGWSYLGLTDAMLGRCDEAIQEGKRAYRNPSFHQRFMDRVYFYELFGGDLHLVRR